MATRLNRMQFLRGDFKGEAALRPPWAIAEDVFVDTCDRCDRCIKACPSNILFRGGAGFPEVNFSQAGCDFCQACVEHCPTQALSLDQSDYEAPWSYVAHVKDNCLSERGVVCRSCGDVCETRTIKFKLVVGGSALLELNTADCNGCGECVSICPVNAIEIKPIDNRAETLP